MESDRDDQSCHDNFAENPLNESNSNAKEHLIDKAHIGVRSTKLRWVVLLLACFTNFGNYFSFDNPQALQTALNEGPMGLTSMQVNVLYSVYSMPNIVLPFFGGIIVDKIGVRIALGVFPLILVLGQAIVTIGVAKSSYGLMIAGRVVFGLGGECLGVSQSSVTAKWFMGKELALALGATLVVSRMGSSLNSFLSPSIASATETWMPFLVGCILCGASWCAAMGLGFIDKKADDQEGASNDHAAGDAGSISIKDLKSFKRIYFLLLFNCFFLYGAFFGLTNNLNDLMHQRFGFSNELAGDFIPIIYVCSAIITPLFGMYTDRNGKRVLFMLFAAVIFVVDHLAIAFMPDTVDINFGMIGVLIGVGLFYATYAAIFWPCIPLVVKDKLVGTAYGIVCSLQNTMLAIIPLVIGAIHDGTQGTKAGYFWTEITLAGVVVCGLFVTIWLYIEDMRTGGKLNRPGTAREKASAMKSVAKSFAHT